MPAVKPMQMFRFLLPLALTVAPAFASQETPPSATEAPAPGVAEPTLAPGGSFEERSLITLAALRESYEMRVQELATLRDSADPNLTGAPKLEYLDAVAAKQAEIRKLEYDFETVATGIDVRAFDLGSESEFDLIKELEGLLKPILSELRDATEAPREMERLRDALDYANEHVALARQAIAKLNGLIELAQAANASSSLIAALEGSRAGWQAQVRDLENQRTVAEFQLEQNEARKRSVVDSMRDMFSDFFRTRGINLLYALLTFVGVLLSLRWLYRFSTVRLRKHSRGERKFYARLLDVLYFGFSGLAAVAGALLVLYSAGDWAMLGLAILILLGLGWASKTAVPMFFEQIRLLLNLGSVREGERVLYQGLVWRVTRLSINTLFVNPKLAGGVRRVPLRDMVDLRSRASAPHEPWFPTSRNDWVLIEGKRLGQVTFQSPELVQIQLLGGSMLHFAAPDFVSTSLENLSQGFRVRQRFGVDYSHQAISAQEIPVKMQAALHRGLSKLVKEEALLNVQVELIEAGASSIDYVIQADCTGDAAPQYQQIERAIQRLLVETCN
ncbi:MAG: hypothetical protein KDB61_06170, partial [Planctomycetes bacterium]|nr:hypothetical protein [Planctomycetota bacterium]